MTDRRTGTTVLLVDMDASERDRSGEGLEEAGFVVLGCPGPSAPEYTCVGARERHCPLLQRADAVVLDLWTGGDALGVGTSAEGSWSCTSPRDDRSWRSVREASSPIQRPTNGCCDLQNMRMRAP